MKDRQGHAPALSGKLRHTTAYELPQLLPSDYQERRMKVLVGFEFSGVVRDAFKKKGHEVLSCDLLETERPGNHIVGNFFDVYESDTWDMILAFPPCTYLANSGVRWLHNQPGRWELMRESALLFKKILSLDVPKIAVENPVMHGYAKKIIGKSFNFSLQPYEHGHGETKRTCFWTKNLPDIRPSNIVEGRSPRVHHESPRPDRWKNRSRSLPGVAAALADQWG